jgi:RNase P/RNase MRP subunit p29
MPIEACGRCLSFVHEDNAFEIARNTQIPEYKNSKIMSVRIRNGIKFTFDGSYLLGMPEELSTWFWKSLQPLTLGKCFN